MSIHAPLQIIVDSLAADIGRDVAVDDRQIRWIVHSPHDEPPDTARMRSILARRVPEEALRWAFSFGIEDADGPVRLPANPDIGAEPRVCIPLRAHGALLGFMFIVGPDESLEGAQLARAEQAAREAALVLYRERRLRELERERERWLLTHLLDDPAQAEAAARALAGEALLEAGRAAVLVIRAEADPAGCEVAVGAALDRLRRVVPARGGLELRRGDHGVFVTAVGDAAAPSPRDLAERLIALGDEELEVVTRVGIGSAQPLAAARRSYRQARDAVAVAEWLIALGDEELEVVTRVGIGSAQPLAAARRSYRQARDAVAVAERVGRFGRIAVWDELGVYRTLARLPGDVDDALHPGLAELLADPAHRPLVETLEAYLDRAGDAKATAEARPEAGRRPPPSGALPGPGHLRPRLLTPR